MLFRAISMKPKARLIYPPYHDIEQNYALSRPPLRHTCPAAAGPTIDYGTASRRKRWNNSELHNILSNKPVFQHIPVALMGKRESLMIFTIVLQERRLHNDLFFHSPLPIRPHENNVGVVHKLQEVMTALLQYTVSSRLTHVCSEP
jgi:hypothetical protein